MRGISTLAGPLGLVGKAGLGLALCFVWGASVCAPVQAQESWNPFQEKDELAARKKVPRTPLPPPLPPMNGPILSTGEAAPQATPGQDGFGTPAAGNRAQPGSGPLPTTYDMATARGASLPSAVERMDLPPVGDTQVAPLATSPAETGPGPAPASQPAPKASVALQGDIWRGLDLGGIEQLIARAYVPPRSPALHALWTGLLTSQATPPTGSNPVHLKAVQMEGLYRSGLITELGAALGPASAAPQDALTAAFRIRYDLAAGNTTGACDATRGLLQRRADLPKALRGELHLLSGYCAAAAKNTGASGLAAELAREEGIDAPLALAVLDSIAGGGPPNLQLPKRILLLDYRLLEQLGPLDPAQFIDKAEPALLAALAASGTTEPRVRVAAAEAASRINAITPAALAEAYRAAQGTPDTDADPSIRRALILQAIDREPAGPRRDQLARAFADEARKTGLFMPVAAILAALDPNSLSPAAADLSAETALAAGQFARVRVTAGSNPSLAHWLALADAFDPSLRGNREQNLGALDVFARRARLSADLLHKLATVLDALDINVPLPLWEAASRTPPPNGFLPETGALPQLDDAAKKKEPARTILLSIGALGPNGADGSHIIALGDTIRALRRAGFDAEARRLGLEAVLGAWPKAQAS
jgi:hypothetical protein